MIEVLIQRALPALGGTALTPFNDVRSARDWLKLLPMINVPVAHQEISQAISVNSETSRDVSKTVENFASLSEENSAAAKEVAITASELSKLAESLSQLTSTFKTS